MTKNNNVINEIKDLIHQIKTEYREGIDFEIPYHGKTGKEKDKEYGAIWNLSIRLRKFLREKFNIPSDVSDYLDYSKWDQLGNNYYYRASHSECEGLHWQWNKGRTEEEKPKNCAFCRKLTCEEDGRIKLWDEEDIKRISKGDGLFPKNPPNVISYLHSDCSKKYFEPRKRQFSFCMNCSVSFREVESWYLSPSFETGNPKKEQIDWFCGGCWKTEEINYRHLSNKENKNYTWKFEPGIPNLTTNGENRYYFHDNHWIGEKYGKIDPNISDNKVPVKDKQKSDKITDKTLINNLLEYFQKNHIKQVSFNQQGNLVIEYNENLGKSKQNIEAEKGNQQLNNFLRASQRTSLSQQELIALSQPVQNNSPTTKEPDNNYLKIGLGAVSLLVIGVVIGSFLRKKRRANK